MSESCLEPKARKFYQKPLQPALSSIVRNDTSKEKSQNIVFNVHNHLMDKDSDFVGPFGRKPILYCDYIASGKPISFIEDFIQRQVLPFYANTHTTTTTTSLQTTFFRDESRDIFRNAVNADEEDAVIFVGNGCTGAVHKLVQGVKPLMQSRPVFVFASEMEHHSNLLPWRDAGAEVIFVDHNAGGNVNLDSLVSHLENKCQVPDALLIGCFSAASNITGILNNDLDITAILHQYGALSFWDYAAAAPYCNIDMNPKVPGDNNNMLFKDALYFSCHKFIGGPQCPGVLIAKKSLFVNPVPNGAGGGSVFFVTSKDHRYLQDAEVREEGGTPAIVETIRAGLAMQLKQSIGAKFIMEKEHKIIERFRAEPIPNLLLLGSKSLVRLPIISFLIRHPESGLYLHYNFICAVLNDLFGIQARGGCACAGPYAQELLGLDYELAKEFESILVEDSRLDRVHLCRSHQECSSYEILRPGFARLNISWIHQPDEVDYIIESLKLVAQEGWKLLPQYRFNNETGEWRHFSDLELKERKWLGNVYFNEEGEFCFNDPTPSGLNKNHKWHDLLHLARKTLNEAGSEARKRQIPDQSVAFSDEEARKLRWFLLPSEAKDLICEQKVNVTKGPVFHVRKYDDKASGSYSNTFVGTYFGTSLANQIDSNLLEILQSGTSSSFGNKMASFLTKRPDDKKGLETNELKVKDTKTEDVGGSSDCLSGICFVAKPRKKDNLTVEKHLTPKWHSPGKEIFKPFQEAVEEFNMIQNGDRVLVCLSGGKDSLTLMHTLRQYQFYAKKNGVDFELGAITIDPLSSAYDPRPLVPYLKALGLNYLYEEQAIMAQALQTNCSSICAFCSRMKRGRIYAAARREKYNVLAMGQHLDDLAESFLMSVFHNGRLRTMKANYTVKEGDLRVIRPFVFLREKMLRNFAEKKKLPVIPENCPACFENPKERHRTKQLLAHQELLFPRLYWSLKAAMGPLMNVRKTGVESVLFGKINHNKQEEPLSDDEFDE